MKDGIGQIIIVHGNAQELTEHVLSYFADRLFDGADEWPEIEMLMDDMGVSVDELTSTFNLLGYIK